MGRRVLLAAVVVAIASSCDNPFVDPVDTPDARVICRCDARSGDAIESCNLLTQTGCPPGQKCQWIRISTGSTSTQQLGQIGCAPAGAQAVFEACEYGASGPTTGHDNCERGLQCFASPAVERASGTCRAICDLQGTLACDATQVCVEVDKFFQNGELETPVAGLCEISAGTP